MAHKSEAHQIRLAGPWQIEQESGASERIQLPFQRQSTSDPLVVRRTFNGSDGILSARQVWIRVVFEGAEPRLKLNQQQLTARLEPTAKTEVKFDVTSILQKSNSLTLTCSDQLGDRVTDVDLLIFDDE